MSLKNITVMLVAIALAVIPSLSYSAADNALVGRIKNRYEGLKSFSADFTQTLTHKESGGKETRKGRLLFQKPLQIRWQTEKPHEETLVATSREIWDYLPEEDVAYRYSPELIQDSRSIIQVVTGQAALSKDFDVKSGGVEGGLERLALFPREPSTQMVEAMIWVEPESGYIRRARIVDFYGNENDVRFTAFNPDARIADKEFKFTPPKGVEVEDRIDRKVQERELFK